MSSAEDPAAEDPAAAETTGQTDPTDGAVELGGSFERELLPYHDLVAPEPLRSDPPVSARWLAFGSILLGGLLGALIGYGVLDLYTESQNWAAVGALLFGVGGAIGLGVVTSLTLRAMNEWREVQHPERTRGQSETEHQR